MQICMYREVEWHVRLVFWPSACIVCGLRHMKGVVYGVDLIESFRGAHDDGPQVAKKCGERRPRRLCRHRLRSRPRSR